VGSACTSRFFFNSPVQHFGKTNILANAAHLGGGRGHEHRSVSGELLTGRESGL
jgi:hypothetical protein